MSKLSVMANQSDAQLRAYACSQCGAPVTAMSALSPREKQIARLFASGLRIKSISKKLNRSPKTIQTYQARIKEKLNLQKDTDWMDFLFAVRIHDLAPSSANDGTADG